MRLDRMYAFATPTLVLVLLATAVAAVSYPAAPLTRAVAAPAATAADADAAEAESDAEAERLPETLGAFGFFADTARLTPPADAERYDVRFPAWRDGAEVVRHARLPAGAAVEVDALGRFVFPVGSTFVETTTAPAGSSAPGRRLESRVLKKTAERWLVGSYVWNAEGTDGRLVDPYGRTTDVTLPGCDAPHAAPGRIACLQCHAGDHDMVLGYQPLQLGAERVKQLAAAGRLADVERALPATDFAAADDVEREALGYLAGNCAHCHNPGGTSFVPAELDLRPHAVRAAIGRDAYRMRNAEAARVVEPGRPEASVLFRLFERTLSETPDPTKRMPPVGTHSVDPTGLRVLRRWIANLPSTAPETAARRFAEAPENAEGGR